MIPDRQVVKVNAVPLAVQDSQVYKVHRVAPDPKVVSEILDQVAHQVPVAMTELMVQMVHQEDLVHEETRDRREKVAQMDHQDLK